MKMSEEAVSEAIGFILIFGLVLTGIGLVTLYGYPVLLKEQSNADMRNMERAMIVIQNDMKSLCFKNVPYKETTLQVSGGALQVSDAGSYGGNITITNSSESRTYSLGALIYRSDRDNREVALESGAVMTYQYGTAGSAMLAEPRWFYDGPTKTLVINIMNITIGEPMARDGMTTVKMSRLESPEPWIDEPPGGGSTVTVEYTGGSAGDYSVAWRNYLTRSIEMSETSPGSNTYTMTNVDKLVVKEYRIRIHAL